MDDFPMRVPVTAHSVGWIEDEFQAWIAQRVVARKRWRCSVPASVGRASPQATSPPTRAATGRQTACFHGRVPCALCNAARPQLHNGPHGCPIGSRYRYRRRRALLQELQRLYVGLRLLSKKRPLLDGRLVWLETDRLIAEFFQARSRGTRGFVGLPATGASAE
jgi:hypothetical protein